MSDVYTQRIHQSVCILCVPGAVVLVRYTPRQHYGGTADISHNFMRSISVEHIFLIRDRADSLTGVKISFLKSKRPSILYLRISSCGRCWDSMVWYMFYGMSEFIKR